MRSAYLVVAFVLTAACGKSETPAPAPAPTAAPAPVAPAPAPTVAPAPAPAPATVAPVATAPAPEPEPEPEPVAVEAVEEAPEPDIEPPEYDRPMRRLVRKWRRAQNEGEFEKYITMYSPSFQGVKLTAEGKTYNFDRDGWAGDRKKMFDAGVAIEVEDLEIESQSEDHVKLTFVQRFKSGDYADRGTKVLEVKRIDGEWQIVREEMLTAEAEHVVRDLSALVSPIQVRVFIDRPTSLEDSPSDCTGGTMRIYLEDAEGTKETIEVGHVTGPFQPGQKRWQRVEYVEGTYVDMGEVCAHYQQGFAVRRLKNQLMGALHWEDGESGNSGHEDLVWAELPAGAEVKMK